MKDHTLMSLSIQKEIKKQRLVIESEVNSSLNELNMRTLLYRSNIRKEKGYSPVSLLFVMLLLPLSKINLTSLWTSDFYDRFVNAGKDAYYRFLNHPRFNWRKFIYLVVNRVLAYCDDTVFNEKVLIADDTLLNKTGKNMELVGYHHDHKTHRSQLGYQMLQLGYHNGTHFFPLDVGFHTSKKRPNEKISSVDRRTNGWRRRAETFKKKTDLLVEMLQRAYRQGIDARFVLFDSWFAHDKIISKILDIGYGVICRLKAGKTLYRYKGELLTLKKIWHNIARHQLQKIPQWNIKAAAVNLELPLCGTVCVVFVRWSKKRWHCFLCTETDLEIVKILDYYARRWTIEVYFRDCKQLLELGKGQSETFDALIAWTSIVMLRYLLLVYILSKRYSTGPIGPLFQCLAQEQLELTVIPVLWTRLRQIMMMSSQLFSSDSDTETFLYILDMVENMLLDNSVLFTAKL